MVSSYSIKNSIAVFFDKFRKYINASFKCRIPDRVIIIFMLSFRHITSFLHPDCRKQSPATECLNLFIYVIVIVALPEKHVFTGFRRVFPSVCLPQIQMFRHCFRSLFPSSSIHATFRNRRYFSGLEKVSILKSCHS